MVLFFTIFETNMLLKLLVKQTLFIDK